MKTIKYKFIPLEERSNEDLSGLYASIHVGYYSVSTGEDRRKILKILAKDTKRIKQYEIEKLMCKTLNKTELIAAQVDCGELGILRTYLQSARWRHFWIDKEEFNYQVIEVM